MLKPGHCPRQASEAPFQDSVAKQIASFEGAELVERVARSDLSLGHYYSILTTLFHQTRSSPYTFAETAANCDWIHEEAKEFLLQHADEEKTHWRWILNDLKNTGFAGNRPAVGLSPSDLRLLHQLQPLHRGTHAHGSAGA
jgi:hypothetical protein